MDLSNDSHILANTIEVTKKRIWEIEKRLLDTSTCKSELGGEKKAHHYTQTSKSKRSTPTKKRMNTKERSEDLQFSFGKIEQPIIKERNVIVPKLALQGYSYNVKENIVPTTDRRIYDLDQKINSMNLDCRLFVKSNNKSQLKNSQIWDGFLDEVDIEKKINSEEMVKVSLIDEDPNKVFLIDREVIHKAPRQLFYKRDRNFNL